MVYITGDTHRDFYRIKYFCEKCKTNKNDVLIILGDVGINYYLDISDRRLKNELDRLPITLFCVHGNHEERPYLVKDDSGNDAYEQKCIFGATAYVEKKHPSIIFAKDGEYYHIGNHHYFVIGGAYSVDKQYRLIKGYKWFESEQADNEIKKRVEDNLMKLNNEVDIVLSHTCPLKYVPNEFFISNIDDSNIDRSMENWLDKIEDNINYNQWYFGHYHNYKSIDKMTLLFNDIKEII